MKVIKIITNLLTVIATISIFLVGICFFQIFIQGKKYATLFGYSIFQIVTSSMEPTINAGDRAVVKITNDIQEGDIVIYQTDDMLVCHRIHKINNELVICKGDKNNVEDEPILINSIVGKVIHTIHLKNGRFY